MNDMFPCLPPSVKELCKLFQMILMHFNFNCRCTGLVFLQLQTRSRLTTVNLLYIWVTPYVSLIAHPFSQTYTLISFIISSFSTQFTGSTWHMFGEFRFCSSFRSFFYLSYVLNCHCYKHHFGAFCCFRPS